jgi:hypothetical protein
VPLQSIFQIMHENSKYTGTGTILYGFDMDSTDIDPTLNIEIRINGRY